MRFPPAPRNLLPYYFLARWTVLTTGYRLQSGCDGCHTQGGRTRQPIRLFGGPAPTITAPTPELVSHRTRPESPGYLSPNSSPIHLSGFQPYSAHRHPTLEALPRIVQVLRLKSFALGDELQSNILARDPLPSASPFRLHSCSSLASLAPLLPQRGGLLQEGRVSILPLQRVERVDKGRVDEGAMGGKEERKQK